MSATGRNKPGKERDPLDYYPTPAATVRAILPFLKLTREDTVLDPACGDGAILEEVRTWYGCDTVGIEIDPTRADIARSRGHKRIETADALEWTWPKATILIGNPPFDKSMTFVARSLISSVPKKVWLLPISFLGSKSRRLFHAAHPSDIYILSSRPSFTNGQNGQDGTDHMEYGWFVWPGKGRWRVL